MSLFNLVASNSYKTKKPLSKYSIALCALYNVALRGSFLPCSPQAKHLSAKLIKAEKQNKRKVCSAFTGLSSGI